jgi:hypothetical protein
MICSNAGLFAAAGLLLTGMPEVVGADCRPAKPIVGCAGTVEESVLPNVGPNKVEVARWTACAGSPVNIDLHHFIERDAVLASVVELRGGVDACAAI